MYPRERETGLESRSAEILAEVRCFANLVPYLVGDSFREDQNEIARDDPNDQSTYGSWPLRIDEKAQKDVCIDDDAHGL